MQFHDCFLDSQRCAHAFGVLFTGQIVCNNGRGSPDLQDRFGLRDPLLGLRPDGAPLVVPGLFPLYSSSLV